MVIVALPRQHVLAALEECAEVAIVYSSVFDEVPGSLDLQRELIELS